MIEGILAGAALAASPVSAAQATQPPAPAPATAAPALAGPIDPARLAAAERMLAAMFPDELLGRMVADAVAQEVPGWRPVAPDPSDRHGVERARLRRSATAAEFSRLARGLAPEMRMLLARAYARRLGVAELDAATAFYSGPAGRRFLSGSIETGSHAAALRDLRFEPDPELLAAGARLATRIEEETRHLDPPPPPPPPRRSERERRHAERAERRAEPRRRGCDERADVPAVRVPSPPSPPPPVPPADPARLAAARRMAEAMLPDEAFRQPLPLEAAAEALLALPVSAFVPIVPPDTIDPNASLGQAAQRFDPNFQERARTVSRILSEELPQLLPHAAPLLRGGVSELYARTMTVAELDAVTVFHTTPAGRALARESFTAILDPELARGMALLLPRAAADALGAMVRIGQAAAHLPPPPPRPPAPPPPRQPAEEGRECDER